MRQIKEKEEGKEREITHVSKADLTARQGLKQDRKAGYEKRQLGMQGISAGTGRVYTEENI